jgi:glycosyltransferase involved in cell wall biosynthesis
MRRDPFLLSVIIANYNYEQYVGDAIDSAVNVDWPDVEVIVIDDGSTDGSREILRRYGDRITVLLQENSGQVVASNVGFARARGDVIIFLDSDDLLHPSVVREVAAVWRPGLSKVQFQMMIIDGAGKPTGAVFPQFSVTPTPERVRKWYRSTGSYPTPPGSGNAYARGFLEKLFPLDTSCGRASDSICLAAAPLLGDIVTIEKPLVSYRVHGGNQGAMLILEATRFAREVTRARQRFAYAQRLAEKIGSEMPDHAIDRGLSYLQYRLASLRLAPGIHPIAGDTVGLVFSDVVRGTFTRQGYGGTGKLAILVWAFLVAVSPVGLVRYVVEWRFVAGRRPKVLGQMLKAFGVLR